MKSYVKEATMLLETVKSVLREQEELREGLREREREQVELFIYMCGF